MASGELKKREDRLSIRTSVIVWLSGAVLGWVVAVLVVYSIIRVPDNNMSDTFSGKPAVMQAKQDSSKSANPDDLSRIETASGKPGSGEAAKRDADKP